MNVIRTTKKLRDRPLVKSLNFHLKFKQVCLRLQTSKAAEALKDWMRTANNNCN